MKEDTTLDGLTAGFIAVLVNALNRNITSARMKELMEPQNLYKLRALLLPILDDKLIPIVSWKLLPRKPIITYNGSFFSLHKPTMRNVLNDAYELKLASMSKEETEELRVRLEFTASCVSMDSCCIPYQSGEELRMLYLPFRENKAYDEVIDLDKIDDRLDNTTFFFIEGYSDRSDCIKLRK